MVDGTDPAFSNELQQGQTFLAARLSQSRLYLRVNSVAGQNSNRLLRGLSEIGVSVRGNPQQHGQAGIVTNTLQRIDR